MAATALYLCQAHMSVILLSKATRLQCKTVLTSQNGNKKLSLFGMKRKGQEMHESLTIKKQLKRGFLLKTSETNNIQKL